MWVTGQHPVEELLLSRLQRPEKVLLADSATGKGRERITALAEAGGVPILACTREEWHRRTGEKEGGGIAAEIPEFRYSELPEWIASLPGRCAAFLLDGITDPHNLGTVLRNARAFGFSGVVIPRDRSCPVTPAVFRASAGAAAHVPVVQVTNLSRAIEHLQEADFWVFAAAEDGETDVSNFVLPARAAFVMGSEDKGIRRLVREKCDGSVRIPMEEGTDSVNVGVASGIVAFCVRIQGKSGTERSYEKH